MFILLFSLTQGYLAYKYVRADRHLIKQEPLESGPEEWPVITVQLPVYNERYVIGRLIDSVAELDYPKDKLEIQVLDDSDDETLLIAQERVRYWQGKGINILYVRRPERKGFKAGALKYGLEHATGNYIAIFDADFIPQKDFLQKAILAFDTPYIGMVQTRWEHLNRDASLVTRAQAFTIDAHFRVEQTGRYSSGCFINFNGTAGVWRKECIIDAGNWQTDTLTEDLDLSYRAQLKGWKFVYVENIAVPAELPPVMSAMRSQQYRWNKGGAETAKKLWLSLVRSSMPFKVKWFGSFHLANSTVFIAIMISALCSIPLLHFKETFPLFKAIYGWLSIFLISFFVVSWIYYIVFKKHYVEEKYVWKRYIREFPLYLSFSMGMSFHNAVAVVEGYIGRKTPFVRTPKFNSEGSDNMYVERIFPLNALPEILLTLYFSYGIYFAIIHKDLSMLPFHLMLTTGFGLVAFYSIFQNRIRTANR